MTSTIAAVDIGGTNARFALATRSADGTITLGDPVILKPEDFASFEAAWHHFRDGLGSAVPGDVAVAIAGPVTGARIQPTNITHWLINRDGLEQRLGVERLLLINDFGAMGHAVAGIGEDHLRHIAGPEKALPEQGIISVVGPGTGLGVAHVWRDGRSYRVQSTEGGHVDFAPVDSLDDAILARLRTKYRRVSVERVASGGAIADVYETIAAIEGRSIAVQSAEAIWQAADAADDPIAVSAAERFCLALGTAAGDYALAQGAGAVVLAGGTAQRQAERLIASGFHARFTAKGRFHSLMAAMPVKLVTHPQPGLFGAAAAFAQEHPR